MWFFMFACYLLTLVSVFLLAVAGFQGYFHFQIMGLNHPSFALFMMIIYLFTETLVMFFFVGTGVSIKEYVNEHESDPEYYVHAQSIKRSLYPPMLLNLALVMTVFIIGGGVDTLVIPGWLHGVLFIVAFLHFIKTILIQHRCFKANTKIILTMSGLQNKII
jgi:hypothetical protein